MSKTVGMNLQNRVFSPPHLTRRLGEKLIVLVLRVFAILSVVITASIIAILFSESLGFFEEVSVWEFFTSRNWAPMFEPRQFGVLPIVYGTLFVALGSALISLPLGLAVAIYLSEYASTKFRRFAKPVLEILAGIPSVVFGYFAVIAITPFIRTIFPDANIFNALSAAIVVGIMTLPTVASLSDDAISAVPNSVKDSGYALGATKFEVVSSIVLPSAISGLFAAFILAFSRAIGETMAVTLAAGATPNITLNPLESIQTMTAYIVQVSLGDAPHGTVEYQSIFVVGILLFLMTFLMNWMAQLVIKRLRRKFA